MFKQKNHSLVFSGLGTGIGHTATWRRRGYLLLSRAAAICETWKGLCEGNRKKRSNNRPLVIGPELLLQTQGVLIDNNGPVLFIYLFIYRQRGRVGEREGEQHQCVVSSCAPPTGDLAHKPGMCPDWELNL